ncbi:MAG: hypothetical protein QM741_01390 [Rudaea sp.]|uniref:hypothetical protein n=1 Tax=Rudaea sp. TaxID=2136325 RepID=UPI0039E4510B
MNGQTFLLEVAKALSGCQAIELELKAYISHAFRNIRNTVAQKYAFKFKGEDCENYSLERLIKVFRKLSDNPGLIARLNRFKDKRNFLAHKAIAQCMDDEGVLGEQQMAEACADISAVQEDAETLLSEIFKEHRKLFVIYTDVPCPPPEPGEDE